MISITMNIKALKFVNGESAICELVEDTPHFIRAKNLISFVPMPANNERGIQMMGMPFLDIAERDQVLQIDKRHIICIAEPTQDVANVFYEKFTGIALPPEKKLIVSSV